MTIKIIKRGVLPQEIEYSFECHHCSTEFTATQNDGEFISSRFIAELNRVVVKCPVCGERTSTTRRHAPIDSSTYRLPVDPYTFTGSN